jgi:energy-coupling factor transport system substrate-specific component
VSWIAASLIVLLVALAAGFAWYEREHPTTRAVALVATLAALAALGRIAFAPLPSVKPTTDIVLLSGYVLGGAPGFAVGAVAALASNLFFGQGPWTPWQMTAWGLTGVAGAGLARVAGRGLGRLPLAAACAVAGLGFGAVMNVSLWVMYSGDHTAAKLLAVSGASLPFDVAHAVGNTAFCLAFGPALVRALARFRTRAEVRWRPAAGVAGTALALALATTAGVAAPEAEAAGGGPARAAQRWLLAAQNDDGGWGAAPRQASAGLYTGWAALGVAAAGRNPLDAGRPSAVAWLRAHPRDVSDLGEICRTILVLRAAGVAPRLGSRDLVRELVAGQRRDGSWAGRVNTTSFAVLALRSARRSRANKRVRRGARWIAAQANRDGGFSFAGRGAPSGVDDTAAAVQALASAGRRRAAVTQRAARWLIGRQNGDGGFPLLPGGASNAQSTAWAVQGLLAARREPTRVRRLGSRDPLAYLRSLTASNGEVRYSRTSRQTPVWVTGTAVMALARRALPLAPVHRARRRAAASAVPRPRTPPARPRPAPPAPAQAPRPAARPAAGPLTDALRTIATPQRARAAGTLAGVLSAALRGPDTAR